MVVYRDSCQNWLEDNAVEQQAGRDAQTTPAVSFDFGVRSFEELISPGPILNMAFPQAATVGMPPPLVPLSRDLAGGSHLGNKAQN